MFYTVAKSDVFKTVTVVECEISDFFTALKDEFFQTAALDKRIFVDELDIGRNGEGLQTRAGLESIGLNFRNTVTKIYFREQAAICKSIFSEIGQSIG